MNPPIHLLPTVPASLRVTREELLKWAQTSEASAKFPRLVRSLIAETEPSTERIRMPAGTGVASPNWDGVVTCTRGNRFVPAGTSFWELTTQQTNTNKKASDDYAKRVQNWPSVKRFGSSYVAVACASWNKAQDFASDPSKAPDFRRVLALNVDDLEEWISCAPATTVWLRDLIGKPTEGIQLLARWWEKWLQATTIPLDERFLLAGRANDITELRKRFSQGPNVVTVGGHVQLDEIIAFVAAALTTEESNGEPVTHALFVDNQTTAQKLLANQTQTLPPGTPSSGVTLTLVVPSVEYAQHLPPESSHRMIVATPGDCQAEIVLNALDSEAIRDHFYAIEASRDKARHLAGLARRSLMALRRHLSVQPALHTPNWAKVPLNRILRRSLLLGGWNEDYENDLETVSQFAGEPYADVVEALRQLEPGDSPMTLSRERWHSVTPADTWMLLHNQLSRDDLNKFSEIVLEVLTTTDPLCELPKDAALQARISGQKAKFSPQIRRGVATTLALAGCRPPIPYGEPTPDPNFVETTIRQLLKTAMHDTTPKTWVAISEALPILAEAEPDTVLESLRACIAEHHAFANAMFTDRDEHLFTFSPQSPHIQILNALQIMAWSPDHLVAASSVLAGLALLDPGGRYSNRPDATLAAIFYPCMPNTSADTVIRLQALQMLRSHYPSVAWKLMLALLPRHHNAQSARVVPQFRAWQPSKHSVISPNERALFEAALVQILLTDSGDDPDRWVQLLEQMDNLSDDNRRKIVSRLAQLANGEVDERFKATLWPVLRNRLDHHREYRNTPYVLAEIDLQALEDLLARLRPTAHEVVFGHLFKPLLLYIDGVSAIDSSAEFNTTLARRQTEAVQSILTEGGLTAILDFAAAVENPYQVGQILARLDAGNDEQMLGVLDSAPEAVTLLGLGFFAERFTCLEWDGIERLLDAHDLSPQVIADVLRAPPPIALGWQRVNDHGIAVATEYWQRVSYADLGIPNEIDELLGICRMLLAADRFGLAALLLKRGKRQHSRHPEFADLSATLLESWIEQTSEETGQEEIDRRLAVTLFGVLNEHREHLGTARVAVLEWKYYPLLQHYSGFRTANLYREMLRDLDLFVKFVEIAFMPACTAFGDVPTFTPTQQQRQFDAVDILYNWPSGKFAPNVKEEDELDATSLNTWVEGARVRLAEIDRALIGDQMIGTALAATPADTNGDWPGEAVRDLLETLQNQEIEKGLSVALLRQRGVTCRSPSDGGDQDRQLALRYSDLRTQFQTWPRTANLLSRLASQYQNEGRLHDGEADTFRRGLPV